MNIQDRALNHLLIYLQLATMVYLLHVSRVFANTQVIITINQLCRQSEISFEQNLYQSPNVKKGVFKYNLPPVYFVCGNSTVVCKHILISVQTSYLTIDMWETICLNWFASNFLLQMCLSNLWLHLQCKRNIVISSKVRIQARV